jgi:hypothetical protein
MRDQRWWLAVVVVIVVAAAGAAAAYSLTRGSGGARGEVSHSDYARLWQETHVGDRKETVLERWPKPPYQHYTDNLRDDCFEWSDEPIYLYNLCFSGGVLRSKDLM